MEVTFNFLEIRAMNTYPEHQVTPPLALSSCPAPSVRPLPSASVEMCCRPPAGCHRHGQDHLLAAAADAGAAGSHGQPHQLRPVSSLQQLHLRVSIIGQPPSSPFPRPPPFSLRPRLSVSVLCLRQGAEASWPTLTALDRVLATWQPHFGAFFLFSSQMHFSLLLFFVSLQFASSSSLRVTAD